MPKNTPTDVKRNETTICGLMKARLFYLDQESTDSLSDDPQILNLATVQKTVTHGGESILMWRCFSSYGVRTHIPVIMDQFEYIKILEEFKLPHAEEEMSLICCLNKTMTPNTPASSNILVPDQQN